MVGFVVDVVVLDVDVDVELLAVDVEVLAFVVVVASLVVDVVSGGRVVDVVSGGRVVEVVVVTSWVGFGGEVTAAKPDTGHSKARTMSMRAAETAHNPALAGRCMVPPRLAGDARPETVRAHVAQKDVTRALPSRRAMKNIDERTPDEGLAVVIEVVADGLPCNG